MTTSMLETDATSSRRYRRLLAAHLLVGALIFIWPSIADLYALLVVVQVVRVCFTSRRPDDLAVAIGYLAGTEVLWRMSHAHVPWELSKYLIVFTCICGLVRFARGPVSPLPLTYLAVLVPSSAITLTAMSLPDAREALVSNILGPVTLAAVTLFCMRLIASRAAVARFLWSIVLAVVPMAMFTLLTFLTTRNLTFTDESNLGASGNFGPNQVASALSIGLLVVFLLLTVAGERRYRSVLLGLGSWFLVATLLTFSRGGLLSLAVAAAVGTALAMSDTRRFLSTAAVVAVASGLVFGVLIPRLDDLTGGQLSRRYSDTTSTHRGSIAAADWALFKQSPLLGFGVGLSPTARNTGDAAGRQAHIEYSRLLAEHGVFGVANMAILVALAIRAIQRNRTTTSRAWSAALIAWALVTMAHSDMRLSAVGVAFGFGCLSLRFGPQVPLPGPPVAALAAGSHPARSKIHRS